MQENCREYWNGSKLVPLEQKDRQALMDFYNKTSAVMPCYAVAYRPIYTASTALQKAPAAVYVQLQDRGQSTSSSRARSSSAAARDRASEITRPSRRRLTSESDSHASDDFDVMSLNASLNASIYSLNARLAMSSSLSGNSIGMEKDVLLSKQLSGSDPAMAYAPNTLSRETSEQSMKSVSATFTRGAFAPDKFVRRKSVSAGYNDLLDKQIFLGIIGVQVRVERLHLWLVMSAHFHTFTCCVLVWLIAVASTTHWQPRTSHRQMWQT